MRNIGQKDIQDSNRFLEDEGTRDKLCGKNELMAKKTRDKYRIKLQLSLSTESSRPENAILVFFGPVGLSDGF